MVVEDLARARAARSSRSAPPADEGLRELTFAMAEIVAARPRRDAGRRGRRGSCSARRRPTAATSSPSRETGEGWRVRGEKPERWVRQTDFSNDEAVGFLADRLNRLGVEDAAGRARARSRATPCSSATPTTPSSSTSSPASTPAPRCSAAAARTSASSESRPRPSAAARIDEAMADRAEGETRADVARRLDEAPTERPDDRQRPTTSDGWAEDDPDGRRSDDRVSRAGRSVAGARRVVVKVGSSSLTTAEGGIDPDRVRPLVDALAGAARAAAPRSCSSPPARSRPGWPRSASAPAPADLAAPAGGRLGRPGAAGAPLHRGVRPARRHRRPGAAHRRRRHPAQRTTATPTRPSPSCSSSACCRSSTRTTPSPPPRSASATTTGSPRWSPTSCTPTCWCCSPTSTGSTTPTRRTPRQRRWSPTWPRRADLDDVHVGSTGAAGLGTGGMHTKVEAARIATGAGIPVVLTAAEQAARRPGRRAGRHALPRHRPPPAHPAAVAGARHRAARARLVLDAGAVRAVVERRASLLPAGVTGVDGHVRRRRPGRPRRAATASPVARGPGQLRRRGAARRCSAAPPASSARELGAAYEREVVHRDDLVLL